jgi:hypothetical protein
MSTIITNQTNDLFLNQYNNIAVSTTRIQEIGQLINNKLQIFLGEIALDLTEGIDYFNIMLNKSIPLTIKINELTSKILEVNGVIGINNIQYSLNNNKTQANFDIEIQTDAGNINFNNLSLLI